MDKLNEMRAKISACDESIIDKLLERIDMVREVAAYKKEHALPVLQPEQEKSKMDAWEEKLKDSEFKEEILDTMQNIIKNSRRIQAKNLFDYNIFLIGFMGAGKSTVASKLQEQLEMKRMEMDEMIAQKQGMSIPEIFDTYGEAYFRDVETKTLIELQKQSQVIVSCGGGIVVRDENADHMKKHGRVILLTARPETVYERVKNSDSRPILNNNMSVDFIAELMEKRREKYSKVADITIETDGKDATEICEEIISKLIAFDKKN